MGDARATAVEELASALETSPETLPPLEPLDAAAVSRLAGIVRQARERDERAIEEALQQTLRVVPRLLRGRAKKLLFPGGER